MLKISDTQKGFSLIEVLVSVMIISILTLGIYSLIILSIQINIDNGNYVIATELANQKMEQIRNLSYADVGTLTGNPSGNIPAVETIFRDSEFRVNTSIRYVQDPFDGLVPPADIVFDDYKIATVEVVWIAKSGPKSVTVFSKIIPRTEETDTGNGLLSILVVDANGNPVATATVHIVNNIIAPTYDQTFLTDSNGELLRSVLPSFEGYEITVTKTDHGVDRTYARTVANPNPTKPHLTVVVGDKTEESFSIDLLSVLNIYTITQDLPDNWQANTDTSGESQTNSRLVIDNSGFVYVVWEDYRQSSQSKIMAQKYSSDGDPQWPNPGAPDEVFVSTANNTVLPDILVDSLGNLYIAWHDNSVGNQEVYLIRLDSADGGDNWGGEKKLNTLADSDNQGEIRIALYESYGATTVTAVWQDDRNTAGNNDIYLQQFDFSGSQVLSPEIRVNQNLITDTTEQYDPAIEADSNGNTYTIWTDDRDTNLNIYGAKHNSSATFQWELKLVSEASNANQYQAEIAIDSNNYIYLIWTDERNGNKDIYAQKYDTNGATQWASDILINTDASLNDQYEPSIAIDSGNNFYVIWTDERNGNKDIYAQKYDTDGIALWVFDLRVNINTDDSDQYSPEVIVSPVSDNPYATWVDERNGDADVFITEFNFYGASSTIPNIPVAITGSKQIGDNPIIYEYNISTTTDGVGNIQLTIEWDTPGYTIDVVSASTSYSLIFIQPNQPTEVLPNTIVPVTMYLEN